MNSVEQFNSLDGRKVKKEELIEINKLAEKEGQKEVVKRIDRLFKSITNHWLLGERGVIVKIRKKAKWMENDKGLGCPDVLDGEKCNCQEDVQGLAAPRHSGMAKKALTDCGRLKKGFRYQKGGEIVEAKNKKARSKTKGGKKTDLNVNNPTGQLGLFGSAHNDDLCGLQFLPESFGDQGLGAPVKPDDIYQYVTDLIINTINRSNYLPWQQSWEKTGLSDGLEATNYETKKGYRGINYFLLNFEVKHDKKGNPYLVEKKWDNPYFLTFKQIEKYKGKLKRGSKGNRVVYFTKLYGHSERTKSGDKLEFYSYDKRKFRAWLEKNKDRLEILKRNGWSIDRLANSYIPILKYYNVFNAQDITGIKWANIPKNKNASRSEKQKIAIAEAIVENYPKPPKIIFKGDQPHYRPNTDTVYQTPIQHFKDPQNYYSVLFHELVHSTGHESRLDRQIRNSSKSAAYAKEELVAEMGAVFLCAESGILFRTLNNSAAYLKGWNSRLVGHMQKDNRYFFRAASAAQAATDHILSFNAAGIPKYRHAMEKSNDNSGKSKSVTKKTISNRTRKKGVEKVPETGMAAPVILDNGNPPLPPRPAGANGDAPAPVLFIPKTSLKTVVQDLNQSAATTESGMPAVEKKKGVLDSKDLMAMHFETLDFTGEWNEFMQEPAKNMKVAIWGKPKNGKTAGALSFANYITRFGSILYNFADQGYNKNTQKLWKLSGLYEKDNAYHTDTRSLDQLEKQISEGGFDFVIIDMINTYINKEGIKYPEFEERFIKRYPETAFILVFEVTKSGNFKGDQGWTHIVDATVTVEDFVMSNRGRYGMGEKVVYPEGLKKMNPKRYQELIGEREIIEDEPIPDGEAIPLG